MRLRSLTLDPWFTFHYRRRRNGSGRLLSAFFWRAFRFWVGADHSFPRQSVLSVWKVINLLLRYIFLRWAPFGTKYVSCSRCRETRLFPNIHAAPRPKCSRPPTRVCVCQFLPVCLPWLLFSHRSFSRPVPLIIRLLVALVLFLAYQF